MKRPLSSSRRHFLRQSVAASLGFAGLGIYACKSDSGSSGAQTRSLPISPQSLIPDPKGLMNLPEGFSYRIISRWGDPMSDGFLTPNRGDGMATFPGPNGQVILVRNHEVSTEDLKSGPFGAENELLGKIDPQKMYDFGQGKLPALGGTTTLVYDENRQEVISQYLSLAGTIRNCAGGPTPWNSWITCEETTERAGHNNNEHDHGFNFEVPAGVEMGLASPVALTAMGRFNHEAVAVDPRTGIVYQTEDQGDGLIYRFIPEQPGVLAAGGKLQAMALVDQASMDTRNWPEESSVTFPVGERFAVKWIDLENVLSPEDDLRHQGFDKGAVRFARGEGMWFGNNEIFFACTNGGKNQKGQVFRYIPSVEEDITPGQLELFAEPNDINICKNCDNLTVAPWGDLFLCEDAENPFVVRLTAQGEFSQFGANVGHADSELTGVCFSPSGKTMFVNIQHYGLTLAITGPWERMSASA